MAELDIQKKRGTSWVWWIVGLIVLALILWWMFGGNRNAAVPGDVGAVTDTTASATAPVATAPAPTAAPEGALTDLGAITGATDAGALVGRQVELRDAHVLGVVGDRGFWVGPDSAQRLFAVRANQGTPPGGAVKAGQTVNLHGVVKSLSADLAAQRAAWKLSAADSAALAGQRLYVSVDSLTIAR
jgi:hypothetical protein